MGTYTGKWQGGRVRRGQNDEPVWVIEAMRRQVRYSISLDASSEKEALAELALFERGPVAYQLAYDAARRGVARDVSADSVILDDVMLEQYEHDALHGDPRHRIGKKHLQSNLHYLDGWMAALAGRDLRTLKLREYRAHLRALEPRRHHVVALRALTHWLRREGRLSTSVDESRDLEIPQGGHRRAQRPLGCTMENFEKLYGAIRSRPYGHRGHVHHSPEDIAAALRMQEEGATVAQVLAKYKVSPASYFMWKKKAASPAVAPMTEAQAVRDVLAMRALCGMHHTEVERVAAGAWKVRRLTGYGEIAGTVTFIHKKGLPHPQALCAKALAAAERLQARGSAPSDGYVREEMERGAQAAGLARMTPGELRHSFVTWSRTYGRLVTPAVAGVPREAIARIVGHTAEKTTTIYDGTEVPELIVLPLRLENEEDPSEGPQPRVAQGQ